MDGLPQPPLYLRVYGEGILKLRKVRGIVIAENEPSLLILKMVAIVRMSDCRPCCNKRLIEFQ